MRRVAHSVLALCLPVIASGTAIADGWHAGFGAPPGGLGTNGEVWALEVFEGSLVAAGSFTQAGAVSANRVASFDGVQWSVLGSGFADGPVHFLIEYGGDLYAGGEFTTVGGSPADYLARWTGSSWQPTGAGLITGPGALGIFDGKLYTAQYQIGTPSQDYVNQMKIFDGVSWSTHGAPGYISSFVEYQGAMHATVGESLYRLDGTSFIELDQLPGSAWVNQMLVHGDNLLLVGNWNLYPPGGTPYTTGWNGSNWVSTPWEEYMDSGLVLYNDRLVVCGNGIASFEDGSTADPDVFYMPSRTLEVFDGDLFVGGSFTSEFGYRIARWTDPAVVDAPPSKPAAVTLSSGRPNPFNPRVTFQYSIPKAGFVQVTVHDLRGSRVATLRSRRDDAGTHPVEWDGTDQDGKPVASGSYVVRVEHPAGTAASRVVLLK
jgi:hypothetical protein